MLLLGVVEERADNLADNTSVMMTWPVECFGDWGPSMGDGKKNKGGIKEQRIKMNATARINNDNTLMLHLWR